MLPLVAITTDPRAIKAIVSCQAALNIRIEVAADFDQGLKTIFAKRLRLIFVQDHLDDVSANVVARHVKGLLRNDSPVLVLLCQGPCRPEDFKHTFDDAIDLTLPDHDVEQAFYRHIQSIVMKAGDGEPQEAARQILPLPAVSEEALSGEEPPSLQLPPSAVIGIPAAELDAVPEPDPLTPLFHPLPPEPLVYSDHLESGGGQSEDAAPGDPVAMPADLDNYDLGIRPSPGKGLYWALLLVILAVAGWYGFPLLRGGGTALDVSPSSSSTPPPSPTALPSSAQQAQGGTAALIMPSVLEGAALDAAFAASHQGWERRIGTGVEYRIFRDGGAIKAIQALATGRQALPAELVPTLLSQAAGSAAVTPSGTTERNGYSIEQGTAGDKAEVELYRHLGTRQLRGLVITVRSVP
jgi:flagellar FliL protein